MPEIQVYVIDIANIRPEWIGNPSNVRQAIAELATPKRYKVNHISSLDKLDRLVRNPLDEGRQRSHKDRLGYGVRSVAGHDER